MKSIDSELFSDLYKPIINGLAQRLLIVLLVWLIAGILTGCHTNSEQSKKQADGKDTMRNESAGQSKTDVEAENNPDKRVKKEANINGGREKRDLTRNLYEPPVTNEQRKTQTYSIRTKRDTIIKYSTGTEIYIPANAFLNQSGKVVKGQVKFRYRELHSPFDFYADGIPMEYEQGEKKYVFESAGMCQAEATKNERELKVNPEAQIKVTMQSFVKGDDYQVYHLDEANNEWEQTGDETFSTKSYEAEKQNLPARPVLPKKAGSNTFKVEDPAKYPEIFSKSRHKFSVQVYDVAMTRVKPDKLPSLLVEQEKLKKHLNDQLDQTHFDRENRDKYEIRFVVNKKGETSIISTSKFYYCNACKQSLYRAIDQIPELDPAKVGNDEASVEIEMEIMWKNNEVAFAVQNVSLANQKFFEDVYFRPLDLDKCKRHNAPDYSEVKRGSRTGTFWYISQTETANGKTETKKCLCALAFKDRKRFKEAKAAFKRKYKPEFQKYREEAKALKGDWSDYRQQVAQNDYPGLDVSKREQVERTFELNEFGYTNIDKPQDYPQGATLAAEFTDRQGNPLHFKGQVQMVEKQENALYRYADTVYFDPGQENILWGITQDGNVAYFKPNDFRKIRKKEGSYTFRMSLYKGEFNTKSDIERILMENNV